MNEKDLLERKNEIDSKIQGFGIELNQHATQRIDRLVDRYESEILNHLNGEYVKRTSWSDRLADKIATFGGSWRFILIFALFLLIWTVWNSLKFTSKWHFDPVPFILLNLCLSFIAAFQAPIIMMSQNRQAARDKHESIIDFAINYKSEQEIDDVQSKLYEIHDDLNEIKQILSYYKETK